MTVVIENIKKFIGWCPNASTIETRKAVQFDDIMVNVPDSSGELNHTTAKWWNKWRNRVLFNSFILTVLAITWLNKWFNTGGKDNMNLFFYGLITGIFFSIGAGIAEWRRLNKAAAGEYRRLQFTRRKKIINYLIIVGLIAIVIFVIIFVLFKTGISIREQYPFLSGLVLFAAWTQYLEVVYWERKNRKTLIVEKTSFYAIDVKAGSNK